MLPRDAIVGVADVICDQIAHTILAELFLRVGVHQLDAIPPAESRSNTGRNVELEWTWTSSVSIADSYFQTLLVKMLT